MQCPKCKAQMEQVTYSATEVDRCTECKGLWFDMLEHEDVSPHAAELDTGDAAVGASFNKVDVIPCPVCPNSTMIRMVDARQPHIWFESCPICFGRYFDAGEFRDLTDHSLSDFFKRFGLKARN